MSHENLPTNRDLDIAVHRASLDDAKLVLDGIFEARRKDIGTNLLSLHQTETERLEIAEREKELLVGFGNAILPSAIYDYRNFGMYFDVDDMFTAHLIRSYAINSRSWVKVPKEGDFDISDTDLGGFYFPIGYHPGDHGLGEILAIRPSYSDKDFHDAALVKIVTSNSALGLIDQAQSKLLNMQFTQSQVLELRPAGKSNYMVTSYLDAPKLFESSSQSWFSRRLTVDKLLSQGIPKVGYSDSTPRPINDFRNIKLSDYKIDKKMTELAIAFGKTDILKSLYDIRLGNN